MKKLAMGVLALLLLSLPAMAQLGAPQVSASWTPLGRLGTPISVTSSSARTPLPTGGDVASVCNVGSTDAYVQLGDSTVTVLATTGSWVKAGTCSPLQIRLQAGFATNIAAITASSTTTLNVETGIGTPPQSVASSGGGGGGSVTQGTVPWVVSGQGTAGAAATGVVTVQGIASMTPLLMNGNASNASSGVATGSANIPSISYNYGFNGTTWDQLQVDASKNLKVTAAGLQLNQTTSGQSASLVMGAVTTAAPGYTTAQSSPLSLTLAGGLRSDISSVAGTALGAPANFGTSPGAVVAGSNNTSIFVGTTVADGNSGNKSAGTLRVTPATDSVAVALWGHGATGATAPANATQHGGRAASTDPTAVTDGQLVAQQMTLTGRTVTAPYAIKELMVRGTADSTDGAAHTIIASAGGSLKNYITDWECSNTSATAVTATFNDVLAGGGNTKVIIPAGGGNNKSLHIPLVTAAATAFQFTSSSGVSTVTCNAQGYTGL